MKAMTDVVTSAARHCLLILMSLPLILSLGCPRFHSPQPRSQMQEFAFPVDVTLTRNNLAWAHFTPKDYYNPAEMSRFEVWIKGRYNKSGMSPGLYGWLRITFADSAGNFSNIFYDYDYISLEYNAHGCPAFINGEDSLVSAYVGSAKDVLTLGEGPGSGYSILLAMAAAVADAVSDSSCVADTAIAPDDTMHISEIRYKVYSE